MAEEWHDNGPNERFDPSYRRTVFALVFSFMLSGGVLLYFVLLVGNLRALALPAAILSSVGLATILGLIVLSVENRFAAEVRFESAVLRWRTRRGKSYVAPYSRILRILPSRWKSDWASAHDCRRYFVELSTKIPGLHWNLPLTPENKTRLEEALRRVGR